jgi:DNA-binding CsgD family transcriptional regulator/tetratricopeptide (TPR) repeat protein
MRKVSVRCPCRNLIHRSLDHWRNTEVTPAIAYAKEGARAHRHDKHGEDLPVAGIVLTLQLTQLREPWRAEAALDTYVGDCGGDNPTMKTLRANIRLVQGRYEEALDLATQALSIADDVSVRFLIPVGHIVMASASLRLCDMRSAVRYARKLTEDSLFGRLDFLSADAAWIAAQVFGMERGSDAAAGLMHEVAWRAARSRELLVDQPAAAPALVRFSLDAGDLDTAKQVARAARLVASKNGDFDTFRVSAIHAKGLIAGDSDGLLLASTQHADPWARAWATEDAGALLATAKSNRAQGISLLEKALRTYGSLGSRYDIARVKSRLREISGNHHVPSPEMPVAAYSGLTITETHVADLVSQGLTNTQVANQMFLSRHTVAYHLKSIFSKLNVSSRGELTSLWVQRSLVRSSA